MTEFQERVGRSRALSEWIRECHPGSLKSKDSVLEVTLFSIALDHREAILLLLQAGARTSAFALARSLYEAFVRGAWAQHCATSEDRDRAYSTGVMPGLDKMVRDLGKVGGEFFRASKDAMYGPLSDYTHTGMRQVVRWTGAEGIAPRHSDIETIELIDCVDVYAVLASMCLAKACGHDITPYVSKVSTVTEEHKKWKAAREQPSHPK